jgi:hypothetical protein
LLGCPMIPAPWRNELRQSRAGASAAGTKEPRNWYGTARRALNLAPSFTHVSTMTPQSAGLAMDAVVGLIRGSVSSESRKVLIDVRDI